MEKLKDRIRREVIHPALAEGTSRYVMNAEGVYTRPAPLPDAVPLRDMQAEVLDQVVHRGVGEPAS